MITEWNEADKVGDGEMSHLWMMCATSLEPIALLDYGPNSEMENVADTNSAKHFFRY